MKIFMEIIKGIFFFVTALLALLLLRGHTLFLPEVIDVLYTVVMPGYLLLCGLIIGYIIWLMRMAHETTVHTSERIYKQSFLLGIWLWLFFSFLYIFLQ